METKKLIGAAAFSLALVGGGVAGALIGTPGTSGAQEPTTTMAADPADGAREGRHADLLEAAATALGITADELRAELEAGKTIADVAAERSVDVQTVIDAVVAAGEDEHVARVTALVNGELREHHGGHHRGFGMGLEAAATALGMTTDELREALAADGATLASVAEAQGVDVQVVIDALVAEAREHLDQAVADGRLTQAEADEKAADLEARITEHVNSERPDGPGFGGRGGPARSRR